MRPPGEGGQAVATRDISRSRSSDRDDLPNKGVFGEAQTLIEQANHAWVHDPVNNAGPSPARAKNAAIHQALKLVGDGLRFHGNRHREITDGQLARPYQGMDEAQAGIVGEHLEDVHQLRRLFRRYQRTLAYIRLW
jgi:hypothetical protein